VKKEDKLTHLERQLVMRAAAGEELDCTPMGVPQAELDQIQDWYERKIRAEIIVALCTGENPSWSVHPRRGLRLRGAKIVGQVDLSRAQLSECPLAFHTCCFTEGVSLSQTTTAEVSFTSCRLPSLHGDTLNSSASLSLTKTELNRISLVDASFRGSVELSRVRLDNSDGIALNCERMSAASLSLRHTNVEGEVTLEGAQVRGVVSFLEDTRLKAVAGKVNTSDRSRKALNGDRLNTGELNFRKTHVESEVSLLEANIRAQLIFRRAHLINPKGYALSGYGMSATNVFLRGGTHVEGEMSLLGANISGTLECSERAELIKSGEGGVALSCATLKADRVLLREAHIQGMVSLMSAQISGDVRLRGTYVKGMVNLMSTQISGSLSINGGGTYDSNSKLINPGGTAVHCQDLKAANVFLQNTHVEGEVNLWSAHLRSDFYCRLQTQLHNRGGAALSAQGCQVEGKLLFWLPQAAVGMIDLARAKVGALDDDLESWPDTINLEGFSYYSLDGDKDVDKRLEWIRKSKPFSPDVYSQLAEVYRRSGEESHARKIAIEREGAETSAHPQPVGVGVERLS
jgi:uncharacterized protein YjbI with pentapeptide repeats